MKTSFARFFTLLLALVFSTTSAWATQNFTLGTSSLAEGPAAGTDSISLADADGSAWSATSNASWLHVDGTTLSGTASTNVLFSFDANTDVTRTGTLTIAGITFTVTQAGATYSAVTFPLSLNLTGISQPHGLALDAAGDLFIVNQNVNSIVEFSASTRVASNLVTGLNGPVGAAADASGNLYIADNNGLNLWSASTQTVTTVVPGHAAAGVAVDAAGNVYFSDFAAGSIRVWNPTTQMATTIVTGLMSAGSVAVDAAGNVYYLDRGTETVYEWSASTQISTPVFGGLTSPLALAVDAAGNIYVADFTSGQGFKKWSAVTKSVSDPVGKTFGSGVALNPAGDLFFATGTNALPVAKLPRAFVDNAAKTEAAGAGTDSLPAVVPGTEDLQLPFGPLTDQSWLTIDSTTGGVVQFSFTANTDTAARSADILLLNKTFTITQNPAAPAGLTYSTSPASYPTSIQIADNSPTLASGVPDSYSVQPALPDGLSLDPQTGVISGTPTTVAAAATYTITVTNAGGMDTFPLSITITDGTPPTITPPDGGFTPLIFSAGALPDFRDKPITMDNVAVTGVSQSPMQGSIVAAGPLQITLTAADAAGNTSSLMFNVVVRPAEPVQALLVGAGKKADGGGASVPGHATFPTLIPADAKFSSLGVPAIDEQGNVVFLGKWTSATGPHGTGLFTNSRCVAVVGEAGPIANTKYKTLSDPIISNGNIAFLATLSGVPAAQASVIVLDPAPSGGSSVCGPPPADILTLVAQSGTDSGSNGAKLKSFKGIQVIGDAVGYFANLTIGTGSPKVTAATALGLFLGDGVNPPLPLLRTGDSVGAKKVKTLVSFAVGAGSPGQGRGWLTEPYNFFMSALVTYTDHPATQAVLSVSNQNPIVVCQTGTMLGSAGDAATLGLPDTNGNYGTALLATLALGGNVTKANQRGIFFSPDNSNTFSKVAQVGDPVPWAGSATFSVLKDPVLADDGGLAFPATLKGGTVKGANATSLWWQPPGGALHLFARGGVMSGGVPDVSPTAEWASFPSLAIASGRGPLFAATLVANKGGVKSTQTNGVWATDFEGNLRLLFQTGVTKIGARTLKSFQVLKTAVGSIGVTRSFNGAQQVTWLATFTDGSTGIVTTEIP